MVLVAAHWLNFEEQFVSVSLQNPKMPGEHTLQPRLLADKNIKI